MNLDITTDDIVWWEEFLSFQQSKRTHGYHVFVEHLLKLAKAVKEIQEERNV